jgi:apolipoprotein N-acyltransferase
MLRQMKTHDAKELLACLSSGILLVLSFPDFNLWILAWLAFVPLFLVIENKTKARAFLLSYLTGVIFWAGTIYWLVHVTLGGTVLLVLYLALYFGIFGLFASIPYSLPTTYYLLSIPSLWVLLEYIRSHLFTGFPWALLGYSQYLNLPAIQIADITGAWGVSFLVMMVNVFIYKIMRLASCVMRHESCVMHQAPEAKKRFSAVQYILPVLLVSLTLVYGFYKLYKAQDPRLTTHDPRPKTLRISVIQGNIPQNLKWDQRARDFIMDRYFALTIQSVKDNPDLIIWPEAAIPVVLEDEPGYYERVVDFARGIRRPLLAGAPTLRGIAYYNSALLIGGSGQLINKYDKLHLVPFGEYVPLRNIFRFLEAVVPIGDFTRGKVYTVFTLPTTYDLLPAKFSVLICFEDLFPELSRQFVRRGADFLVNITNDAWYKKTSAAAQHFQASVLRAVENRVFLVRAANTGISGFINPKGEAVGLVRDSEGREIFTAGYATREVSVLKKGLSFYSRCGDFFIAVCFLFLLYGIIIGSKNKSQRKL